MKNAFLMLAVMLAATCLYACKKSAATPDTTSAAASPSITGKWTLTQSIETRPGMPDVVSYNNQNLYLQLNSDGSGFVSFLDGTTASTKITDFKYTLNDNVLIRTGGSSTLFFPDTIKQLDAHNLKMLEDHSYVTQGNGQFPNVPNVVTYNYYTYFYTR